MPTPLAEVLAAAGRDPFVPFLVRTDRGAVPVDHPGDVTLNAAKVCVRVGLDQLATVAAAAVRGVEETPAEPDGIIRSRSPVRRWRWATVGTPMMTWGATS